MLALFLTLLAASAPAVPQRPGAKGWVIDGGDLLNDAQEQTLNDLLKSYTVEATSEIAVVTIPALDGQPIETSARRVAREWPGTGDRHMGVLLIIARDDRLMQWEVGRELNEQLTDVMCGRIVRDIIRPEFEKHRYYEGIRGGIEAAHAALQGDLTPIRRSQKNQRRSASNLGWLLFAAIVPVALFVHTRRRKGLGSTGALPTVLLSGVGRHAGYRCEVGDGHFGGTNAFGGGGATGIW